MGIHLHHRFAIIRLQERLGRTDLGNPVWFSSRSNYFPWMYPPSWNLKVDAARIESQPREGTAGSGASDALLCCCKVGATENLASDNSEGPNTSALRGPIERYSLSRMVESFRPRHAMSTAG